MDEEARPGRPRKDAAAIAQPTLELVLAYFADYTRIMDSGRPWIYRAAVQNRHEDVDYYAGVGATSDNCLEKIGFRGKLYALYLIERHRNRLGKTAADLAKAIVSTSSRNASVEVKKQLEKDAERRALISGFSRLLSTKNIKALPRDGDRDVLRACAVVYFADLLLSVGCRQGRTSVEARLDALLASQSEFPDVRTCYEHLLRDFEITKSFKENQNKPFPPTRFSSQAEKALSSPKPANEPVPTPPGPAPAAARSWMDEEFRRQITDSTRTYPEEQAKTELGALARELHDKLTDRSKPQKLAILQGAPHSGKKSVIAEMLREIDRKSKNATLMGLVDRDDDVIELPVMAIVARSRDQNALALYIRAFLQRLDDIENAVVPYWATKPGTPELESYHSELVKQAREAGGMVSTERTLAEIARLSARHPACYFFADVDGLGRDSILKLLLGYEATRLLNILNNHRDTRIVVSAYDRSAAPEIRLDLDEAAVIQEPVPNPELGRLTRYWHGKSAKPVRKELVTIWQTLRDELKLTERHQKLEGESLVVAAAILQHCAQEKGRYGKRIDETVSAIASFARKRNQAELTAKLSAILLSIFEAENLLPAVSLILAAEDGLLRGTLIRSLESWKIDAPDFFRLSTEGQDDVELKLKRFKDLAGGFFLRQERNVRLDEHEFGLDETEWRLEKSLFGDEFHPLSDADVEGLLVWSFDPAVRTSLIRQLQIEGGQYDILFRQANRLVARAARRRAQHKKVNLPTPFSMQPQTDSARDIQAYICLLASITEKDIVRDGGAEASLFASTESIFSLGGDFNGGVALNFAYFGLLREDIDRDFRLSMVSDQDMLRLRLYLLMLLPKGQHHFDFIAALPGDGSLPGALPPKIPDHIVATFDPDTIVRLCATIAISAFHAHQPKLIDYAQRLLDEYLISQCGAIEKYYPFVAQMIEDIAHVWFAKLDWMFSFRKNEDFDDWKPLIDELLGKQLFEDLSFENPKGLLAIYDEPGGAQKLRVWMRLKFREAEVLHLESAHEKAREIMRAVVELDNFISAEKKLIEPLVFSGRTARRFIRYAFGEPLIRSPHVTSSFIEESAKAMIEVNISRQRRFAGVDRIGVLIDLARRHVFEGNVTKAVGYITNANIRARRGPMSYSARLELLACLSSIRLWCALSGEIEGQREQRQFLQKARESALKLINLGNVVDSKYFQSIGKFLAAKAFVERIKLSDAARSTKVSRALAICSGDLRECAEWLNRIGDRLYYKAIGDLIEDIENI